MTELRDKIAEALEYHFGFGPVKEAADAILALIREEAWQPIETAKKRQDEYVLAVNATLGYRAVCVIAWDDELGWCGRTAWDTSQMLHNMPTHWMPLPKPPSSPESSGVEP